MRSPMDEGHDPSSVPERPVIAGRPSARPGRASPTAVATPADVLPGPNRPNVHNFGPLLAGRSLYEQGPLCARCGRGAGYLIGEPGEERHLRCWQDDPKQKGPRRVTVDPGPRLFDPDA